MPHYLLSLTSIVERRMEVTVEAPNEEVAVERIYENPPYPNDLGWEIIRLEDFAVGTCFEVGRDGRPIPPGTQEATPTITVAPSGLLDTLFPSDEEERNG